MNFENNNSIFNDSNGLPEWWEVSIFAVLNFVKYHEENFEYPVWWCPSVIYRICRNFIDQ